MKFHPFALLCLIASPAANFGEGHDHDEECTHGKLYVVDDSTSDVHVIDVSEGQLENLSVETKVTLPSAGAGQLVMYGPPGDPLVIQYRGAEDTFEGSYVQVIDTGFSIDRHGEHTHLKYSDPTIVQNVDFPDCYRPIHQVRHNKQIAIFCDGSFNLVPQRNTTIHVIEESKLGSTTESAIVHSVTIPGAHHGVAIPVDDGHLLHSLALPGRIDRDPNVTSLPATFQVADYQGTILHEIADTSNPDTHCSGFHGSATVDNFSVLGCDDVHGGVLFVDYNPSSQAYTSRALLYPDGPQFDGFRIGSFAYHKNSDHYVGSYSASGGTEFHLAAIHRSMTSLSTSNILTLPNNMRQCAFQFEVGTGEHLLVFMPNGVLHVFEINDDATFTEVMNKEIVPGMTACSEAAFVAGIVQAFVATPADRALYAIDLAHVEDGEMDVFKSTLPFTPTAMTVSGFTLAAACEGHHHDEPTGAPQPTMAPSSASKMGSMMVGLFAMLAGAFAI